MDSEDAYNLLPPHYETYAEGLNRCESLCQFLKKRHGGTDDTILLVGHYHAGSRIVEILLGQRPEGMIKHGNCQISKLIELENGQFSYDT